MPQTAKHTQCIRVERVSTELGWAYRVLIGDFVRAEFPVNYPRHDVEQRVAADHYARILDDGVAA